jgi:hypothetical protein
LIFLKCQYTSLDIKFSVNANIGNPTVFTGDFPSLGSDLVLKEIDVPCIYAFFVPFRGTFLGSRIDFSCQICMTHYSSVTRCADRVKKKTKTAASLQKVDHDNGVGQERSNVDLMSSSKESEQQKKAIKAILASIDSISDKKEEGKMKKTILITIASLVMGVLISISGYAMEEIQAQPSSDGNFDAILFSAKIREEVLTVKIRVKNGSGKTAKLQFLYKDVYYTDIVNKKKYFALKDSEGKYIAGPQDRDSEGGKVERYIENDGQGIFWIKFPAPPPTTETVDIIIPGFLPFEEIAVKR